MQITTISSIFAAQPIDQTITTNGWIRTYRRSKHVAFIELTDGTCSDGLQLVVDPNKEFFTAIEAKLATGASISATGKLVNSQGKGQSIEVQVDSLCVYGEADAEAYPLQKKGHTLEFLREQMHLRPRTNTFGAVFRIRSAASFIML